MIECDNNEEFIIANLSSAVFNETLDLAFNEGEKICFKVDGPGTVHLTGNLMDEDNQSPTGEDFESMLAGSDSEMESEEEEAGERIQEVVEKSGKRKKVEEVKNQEVVAKKAKVQEESEESGDDDESGEEATTDADTTANATTGDDEDSSDDSDDEDDSEEEEEDSKEVEGAKPKQAKKEEKSKVKEAAVVKEGEEDEDSDDDSDDEDDSDEEEEEPKAAIPPKEPKEAPGAEPKLVKKKEVKGKEAAAATMTPKAKSKAEDPKAVAKTPISEAKTSKAGTKTPKADVQTPKAEAKTSKADAETPKAEAKTPKVDAKTPKVEAKTPTAESKTPKAEAKTPKADAKKAKPEAKTPKTDAKTPKADAKTPKAETKGEDKSVKTPKDKAAKDAAATPGKTPKRTLKGGVQVEELKEGSGPEVKAGNMVGMYYEGKLSSNNKQFDAQTSGKPFKFKLGAGQVIKGWDVGVMGMKVGGKRRLTVPAAMAYGKEGSPPDIPPHSTLIFEVDCKFVK